MSFAKLRRFIPSLYQVENTKAKNIFLVTNGRSSKENSLLVLVIKRKLQTKVLLRGDHPSATPKEKPAKKQSLRKQSFERIFGIISVTLLALLSKVLLLYMFINLSFIF